MVLWVCIIDLLAMGLYFLGKDRPWHNADFKALDLFYRQAVARGEGPQPAFSPQVVYLAITDAGYDAFGKNILDREDLARVTDALAALEPAAVGFDIIFARKSTLGADQAFARALENLGTAWLPVGLELSPDPPVQGEAGLGLPGNGLQGIRESRTGSPFSGIRAITQFPPFARAAAGSGNISVLADSDGIYRHLPLVVRVGQELYPTLGLALFMGWAGIRPEDVQVDWGRAVTIRAGRENFIEQDIVIPIDRQGLVYIPFVNTTGADFPQVEAHTLVRLSEDATLRGNLLDLFEGNIVLVADTATGTSDLGDIPLASNAPLVILHASLINSLITRTFYRPWSASHALAVLALGVLILGAAAVLRSPWFLYGTGPALMAGLVLLTWVQFVRFSLFPFATAAIVLVLVFASLVITLETATARDRAFIKTTFARYVPASVVERLLDNPTLLTLGGEEREATVLFSDIAGFTALSERLSPAGLVALLNRYFTEMTAIIQNHGGIIDKYIGDAIMAEFGVPLPVAGHADQAVACALAMQDRLALLREEWTAQGLPKVFCRMGINTDVMVVGNIGSDRVFDYTVLGDAVNLASRLEGANKAYGTQLMISQNTRDRLTPGRFAARLLDVVMVKGQTRAVAVYEVAGGADQTTEGQAFVTAYESAFRAYQNREFSTALQGFEQALCLVPGDRAAKELILRTKELTDKASRGEIPEDWNGAVQLTEK